MCRSQADGSPRHRISRALGSMARRWPYTRSPKWPVVTRSSGRGFVQRPHRLPAVSRLPSTRPPGHSGPHPHFPGRGARRVVAVGHMIASRRRPYFAFIASIIRFRRCIARCNRNHPCYGGVPEGFGGLARLVHRPDHRGGGPTSTKRIRPRFSAANRMTADA